MRRMEGRKLSRDGGKQRGKGRNERKKNRGAGVERKAGRVGMINMEGRLTKIEGEKGRKEEGRGTYMAGNVTQIKGGKGGRRKGEERMEGRLTKIGERGKEGDK